MAQLILVGVRAVRFLSGSCRLVVTRLHSAVPHGEEAPASEWGSPRSGNRRGRAKSSSTKHLIYGLVHRPGHHKRCLLISVLQKFHGPFVLFCALSLSCVQLIVTPWTVLHQAPLSMGFSSLEYWSGLPCPSPGDLPRPENELGSPVLQADSLPAEQPGKPYRREIGWFIKGQSWH